MTALSEGRLLNQLKSVVLLCPIAYLSHMTTMLGVMSSRSFGGELSTLYGPAEFNPKGVDAGTFVRALCAYPGVNCFDLSSDFSGPNCCLNASINDLFLKNEPQSTATRNMVHLSQTARTGILAKYDFGRMDYNMYHYGASSPPEYDLSKIPSNLPLFISYGARDALSDVEDVHILLDKLSNHDADKLTVQFIENYAHLDFIMAVNANEIVYNSLVSFFKNQN